MQKFSELKLCHAFFHSKEGGTKARNLLKYAWKRPWKEVPLNHFSFPGSSPPFTFASYRNNFFSQYQSHATMPMPTGPPVITLGPFWGSSIQTLNLGDAVPLPRTYCLGLSVLLAYSLNPIIPKLIFNIPHPVHTFVPAFRPHFPLKSRILLFRWSKSRIPNNLLGTIEKRARKNLWPERESLPLHI